MKLNIVSQTMIISLVIQFILIFIGFIGFFIKLDKENKVLTDILIMENIVQIIEALMYIWILFSISNFETMVKRRYIDWFITTPIMLLTTIIFMKYNSNKDLKDLKDNRKIITFKNFISDEKQNIIMLFIFNALMLLFGYLGESHIINKNLSIIIGFIFFSLSFNIVYKYINNNKTNKNLFSFLFIIWGMYGVAALLNAKTKNICYNFLDIISKNFYGLYILIVILNINNNTKNNKNDTIFEYIKDLLS